MERTAGDCSFCTIWAEVTCFVTFNTINAARFGRQKKIVKNQWNAVKDTISERSFITIDHKAGSGRTGEVYSHTYTPTLQVIFSSILTGEINKTMHSMCLY